MNKPFLNHTSREKILITLFPAAIVLAVYSVIFAVPMQHNKADLYKQLVYQQGIAVPPIAAENSLLRLKSEKQDLESLEQQLTDAKTQIRELSQSWRAGTSRLGTLEMVSELMRDFNLSIVSQGDDDGTVVSQYVEDLFQLIDQQEPDDPIIFWQVEITGSYFSVVDFLTAVDQQVKHIVPIGLSMQSESSDSSQNSWTIVFAI